MFMLTSRKFFFTMVCSFVAFNLLHAQSRFASIHWLGRLPGGNYSIANSVSNNGVVVGFAESSLSSCGYLQTHSVVYTASQGLIDIHQALGGHNSIAQDITPDGLVVVGNSGALVCDGIQVLLGHSCAWYLDANQVVTLFKMPLDIASNGGSIANSVSFNGVLAAGTEGGFHASVMRGQPFQYNLTFQTGFQLSPIVGVAGAYGISGDGSTIVGDSNFDTDIGTMLEFRPVAWLSTNPQPIDLLASPFGMPEDFGTASNASKNGVIIVGRVQRNGIHWAAVWTLRNGIVSALRKVDEGGTEARDVSETGRIVVGHLYQGGGAYRWLAGAVQGQSLNVVYSSLLVNQSVLLTANGISPNGRYIVGKGFNGSTGYVEGYLLDTGMAIVPTDVNDDACVDDTDLLLVLMNLGSVGWFAEDVDGNGEVDDDDLLMVLMDMGNCED